MQRTIFTFLVLLWGSKALAEPITQKCLVEKFIWLDKSRNREIPLSIYQPLKAKKNASLPIVIFSHGYGQNKGGDYLAYSYLTKYLAAHSFFVASIQHELPTDSLLPTTGILQILRRPFWERGADNIMFVIKQIKTLYPNLNHSDISLIGHSNGGDMTALFPQKYPDVVKKIITLDNRRMSLPVAKSVEVLTLRSNDQKADEGVLPTNQSTSSSNIKIVYLKNTKHNDMDDSGTKKQHREIQKFVWHFLKNS